MFISVFYNFMCNNCQLLVLNKQAILQFFETSVRYCWNIYFWEWLDYKCMNIYKQKYIFGLSIFNDFILYQILISYRISVLLNFSCFVCTTLTSHVSLTLYSFIDHDGILFHQHNYLNLGERQDL